MLTLSQHPGVVELLGFEDSTGDSDLTGDPGIAREVEGDGCAQADGSSPKQTEAAPRASMRLSYVGAHSLATLARRDVAHACGLVAATAETVADLHSIGVVHGRIEASHVLIDRDGLPVLTGFARADLAGAPLDPADESSRRVRPADDLPGLGLLLQHVVGTDTEPDPIPERRIARRSRSRSYARRALLNLADQATVDDPSLRPSARSLAAAIRAVEPSAVLIPPAELRVGSSLIDAPLVNGRGPAHRGDLEAKLRRVHRLGGLTDPAGTEPASERAASTAHRQASHLALDRSDERSRGRVDPRRGWPAAAAAVVIAAVAFALAGSWHGERPNLAEASAPPGPRSGAGMPRPPSAPQASDPTGTPVQPEDGSKPATSGSTAQEGGDPPSPASKATCTRVEKPPEAASSAGTCARSTPLVDGVLDRAGQRFEIGSAGDEVIVGDWACDASPVPAVVRSGTGEVFVFGTWAAPGSEVTARRLATADPGSSLETGPALDSRGCPSLLARSPDGKVTQVLPLAEVSR